MTVSDQQKKKLKRLISNGYRMHLGFLIEYGFYDWIEGIHELIRRERPISFRFSYEDWYSKALVLLENLQPSSLDEFIPLYKNDKLKTSGSPEYAIYDFLAGNEIRRSYDYTLKIAAVKRNLEYQLNMLEVIKSDLEAKLLQSKN